MYITRIQTHRTHPQKNYIVSTHCSYGNTHKLLDKINILQVLSLNASVWFRQLYSMPHVRPSRGYHDTMQSTNPLSPCSTWTIRQPSFEFITTTKRTVYIVVVLVPWPTDDRTCLGALV